MITDQPVKEELDETSEALASFLDKHQLRDDHSLTTSLNELYNELRTILKEQDRLSELKEKLKSVIDKRLDQFSELFEVFSIKETSQELQKTPEPHAPTDQQTEPMDTAVMETSSKMDSAEQAKSVSESSRNAVNMLAEKKKRCAVEQLVQVPYEDHTYAISAASIALALQSSNIFNQNNAQGSNNGKSTS